MKAIDRKQNGQVFIIVLIVLALGSIILAPTLNYTASSLKHQQVLETKALELYSADSGVASGLIALSSGNTTVAPYELNDKSVLVDISYLGDGNYLITSTATTLGGGSTTINIGVSSNTDFTYLFDNAITGNGDITLKSGTSVVGNITAAGSVDNDGSVNGTITEDATFDNWPSPEHFSSYYGADVDKDDPQYPGGVIDLNGVSQSIGPCYVDNDLNIYNSSNTEATLTLDGTLYITGDTLIGTTKKDFILDLNGQTIYCESGINVGDKCRIIGSGCIIAVGDIYFAPRGDVGSENDFVFIMSVTGTTTLQPGGDFNGSIAGAADVNLQPGCSLIWNSLGGEGNLNFPYDQGVLGGSTTDMVLGGWDIS